MLSPSVLRIIIVVALAAHGLAHAIALGGLIAQGTGGASAPQVEVRSWVLPGLGPNAAATIAIPFWLVATLGFLLAALSFWGIFAAEAPWRQVAAASAIASLVGVAFLAGTWPGSPTDLRSMLNTGIAVGMDVAILLTLLWLGSPATSVFGK